MPFSDYTSILAEVGVLGFLAIVIMYLAALLYAGRIALTVRRNPIPDDPLPALALACLAAFFVLLQMGLLQSWLEVTRITFPAWILLAVVTKEFHCRYRAKLGQRETP
jgi:O-antigen ligase